MRAKLVALVCAVLCATMATPPPAAARVRTYPDCYTGIETGRARLCWVHKDRRGAPVVVLFGDSHAMQWWPAVGRLGRIHGMSVAVLVKSSCPAMDHPIFRGSVAYPACTVWRRQAFRLIREIRPDLVIMSSLYMYGLVGSDGSVIPEPQTFAAWDVGIRRTVNRVSAASGDVIMLRDTPLFRLDVMACMARARDPGAECGWPRDQALGPRQRSVFAVERTAAGDYANVHMLDLTSLICDRVQCRPASPDGTRRYRDSHHLDPDYSQSLWPVLARVATASVPSRPGPPTAVRSVRRGRALLISWAPPLSSGGRRVGHYSVRVSSETGRKRCSTRALSCEVHRVRGSYKLAVRARSAAGISIPERMRCGARARSCADPAQRPRVPATAAGSTGF